MPSPRTVGHALEVVCLVALSWTKVSVTPKLKHNCPKDPHLHCDRCACHLWSSCLGPGTSCIESLLSSSQLGTGHSHDCPFTGRGMVALAGENWSWWGWRPLPLKLCSHSLPSGAQTCPHEGLSSGFSGSDSETRPCSGPEASGQRTSGVDDTGHRGSPGPPAESAGGHAAGSRSWAHCTS